MLNSPWTEPELAILQKMARAGRTDREIVERLREAGFDRTRYGLRALRRRMKLGGAARGHPRGPRHRREEGVREVAYWITQRDGDAAFQAALRAAGVQEGVDTTPGTNRPQTIRAEPEIRSRGGIVYPPGVPK